MKNLTFRQKQSIETREKIFNCATKLFANLSYDKVKIADICTAADVSIGSFYHHFGNKESIINEVYRSFDFKLQQLWDDYIQLSAKESIEFLISIQLKLLKKNGFIFATQFFKNQLNNELKYILDKSRFFYVKLFDVVKSGIENNEITGSQEVITDTILRISRGTIYDWCLHEGSYDLVDQGLKDIDMIISYYYRNNTFS